MTQARTAAGEVINLSSLYPEQRRLAAVDPAARLA